MVSPEELITVKGTAEGLVISFQATNWKEIQSLLFERISQNTSFFEKARLALDLGEVKVKSAELGKLRDELSKLNISIWAILATSDVTLNSAQLLGIPTQLGLKKGKNDKQQPPSFEGEAAVWIERTLRAGYRIETKCHVVVFGDVKPGAEIVSAGNVFVWGRVNGAIHAGAEGNKKAKVYALELRPTQLRIADVTSAPFTGKIKGQSEYACIEENKIAIKSWSSRKQN
jgi:septum site-determining protein MinC